MSMTEPSTVKQQYTIVTHHDDWKGRYKAIGPFASRETAKRWLDDHWDYTKSTPKHFYQIVPITPSSKVEGLF